VQFQVCRFFFELVEFLKKKKAFSQKRGEYICNLLMLGEFSQNTRHTLPNDAPSYVQKQSNSCSWFLWI